MITAAVQEKLDGIARLMARQQYEQALQMMTELEQIKPVTLAVQNAKAAVLISLGRLHEAECCYAGTMQHYDIGAEELVALRHLRAISRAIHNPSWGECLGYLDALYRSKTTDDPDARARLDAKILQRPNLERLVRATAGDASSLLALAWYYWETRQRVAAVVCFAAVWKVGGRFEAEYDAALRYETNLLGLYEELRSDRPDVVLFMPEAGDTAHCEMMAFVLKGMGKYVHLVLPDERCEATDATPLTDGAGAIWRIPFAAGVGHEAGSGPAVALARILGETRNRCLPLLSTREGILDLMERSELRHGVKLLSDAFTSSPHFDDHSAFGYLGDYTEYVGRIYGCSVSECISRPASVALSVIIPTRNAAGPLRYTLRTCLEQQVRDVEFMVCDNSTPGNEETRELIEQLNDSRIRYIKPPRPLNLTRSFEYAFLQARGEFLFSMGSDDGITTGGLKTLVEVLEALPECDVIQWDRLFYVWPDSLSDRSGLFQTVRPYRRGQVNVSFYNCLERLQAVLKNPNHVGMLPMLYINSGMRRRYLKKLLERTGQLWDGLSQDVYISVVNCLINKTIPLVEYPLTVAGMGGSSFGVRMGQGWKSRSAVEAEGNEYSRNTIGYVVPSRLERMVPTGHVDSTNLYQSFLRAIQTGCNPEITKNLVDWKWAFVFMMHQSPKDSLFHDRFIKILKWAAGQHGTEFGRWFCEEVIPHAYTPPAECRPSAAGKSYTEGILKDGGMMLNSEKLGVTNVYEACQLFERLLDAAEGKPVTGAASG